MSNNLLTPRYEVVAPNKNKGELPYPNSIYAVGDICTATTEYQVAFFSKYPHIFRPMHWSEGRKLEEMPRYLKRIRIANGVMKVHEYRHLRGRWWVVPEWANKVGYSSTLDDLTPATETEYLEYLKSKEK